MDNGKADVVIVGAGAIGSALARELSKYDLEVVLVEKNEDIGHLCFKILFLWHKMELKGAANEEKSTG